MELTKDSISVNPSSANCDIHWAYCFNNVREEKKKYMRLHAPMSAEFNNYFLK